MLEAFKIGVSISVIDHASLGLRALSMQFNKAEKDALALENRIKSIKAMAIGGGILMGAGAAGLSIFKKPLEESIKYEQQLNKLKAFNLDNRFGVGVTKDREKFSLAISQATKGTTQTEALKLVTETQGITGDIAHTKELAPVMAKMRFGLETYMASSGKGEGHGSQAENQFAAIVKVMEMRGLMRDFTPEKLTHMSDLFTKNYIASGGMVKPSDFLAMMKTAGVSGKSTGEDFMFALGHIMQEKGGSRAGNQMMSAYQNLVAGRTTQQVAEQLESYGLLKKGAVHHGKTGHITKVEPGALTQTEQFIDNPLDFLNQTLLPHLKAKGIDVNDAKKVLPIINQLASNRNASDFLAQLYLERGQISNYVTQAKSAMGVDALYQQSSDSAVGKENDLTAKRINLEKQLGESILPAYVAALEKLNPMLQQANDWMMKNKETVKTLAIGFVGLSAAMMISGSVLLLSAALKALSIPILGLGRALLLNPIGLVLTGIAVAAYLLWKNWADVKPRLESAWTQIKSGVTALVDWIKSAFEFVKSLLPGFITNSHSVGQGMRPPGYHPDTSKQAQSDVSKYIAEKAAPPINVTVVSKLDGREIAKSTASIMSKDASRPQSGVSFFDVSMGLPSPAMGAGR